MPSVRITKKFSGAGDPKEWIKEKIDKIESGNQRVLENAIEDGAALMKDYISTRPTEWMAANRGKTGRIETGKMLRTVGDRVKSKNSENWSGAFGWVDETEGYFLAQEDGGKNSFSGRQIEPMYAMRDAAAEEWKRIQEGIKENIRGA